MTTTTLAPLPTRAVTTEAQSFADLFRLSETLVATGFLPKHIRNPGQAVAIILAGRELGIGPMLALRSICLVEGKVTLAADLQLARFKADGGHATFSELSATRAVLTLTHPNGDTHTESFTLDDAKAAGLSGRDNWKKWPKAMLRSRVITAGLKSIGYEPTAGVYDPEELGVEMPTAVVLPERPATVTEDGEDTAAEWTVEAARAFPFPFRRGTPLHGKPLGDLPVTALEEVRKWIKGQQQEKPGFHATTLNAIDVVLGASALSEQHPVLTDERLVEVLHRDDGEPLPFEGQGAV